MPIRFSTDSVRPAERQAFWTEAICRSFSKIDTQPLGAAAVSGHFDFVGVGRAKFARFSSSPQRYVRSQRLVTAADVDEFMFDFQTRGRSWMVQGANQGLVEPGFGVLYDARRPFEDQLDGAGQRADVLIATVPAHALLAALPAAEGMTAKPIRLSGAVARSVAALFSASIESDARLQEPDVVVYLAALLREASGGTHGLTRSSLFALIDMHLRRHLAQSLVPRIIAAQFGISERTLHRVFAGGGVTFERRLMQLRVARFQELLEQRQLGHAPLASLALACGFADAAHATRAFKVARGITPSEFRNSVRPE